MRIAVLRPLLVLVALWLAACGFDEGRFADRHCNGDGDCPRPDESCVVDTCVQRACEVPADCGPGNEFACTGGACIARGCAGPDECSLGFACVDSFCQAAFDVASATAVTSNAITVTFDAPPDPAQATTLASYAISGLTVSGTPVLAGNTVMLRTSPQAETGYTVTVSGVTRASDGAQLAQASAAFTGRAPFDVVGAASTSTGTLAVTFDAPPDLDQAMTLASYSVPGLTLSGVPIVLGNTVTLMTSPQAATDYTVTVADVTRAADGEPLAVPGAAFTGRAAFDVTAAAATNNRTVTVTFDAPPDVAQATTLANYDIPGLALSGTPTLAGNTVTLTTTSQSETLYTVNVFGVGRASDAETLTITSASFTGRPTFNVTSAVATSGTITVTFDAPPDPALATNLASYAVPGLTLGGTPVLSGTTVTLTTSPQTATTYFVTVSGVVRADDGEPLTTATASFTGRARFNVVSAVATTSTSVTVGFDAAPDPTQATTLANYAIPGLTLSGTPVLSGSSVTLVTSPQSSTTFTVTVANVARASDAEQLTAATGSFTGRAPFDVQSAASTGSRSITITFDAAPNAAQATMLASYSVPGLTLGGAPVLSGNTVTLTTSAQAATTYGVIVSGVSRASDGEPLTISSAGFTGRPPFDVRDAASTSGTSVTVMFDAAPDPVQATTLASYSIPGLSLSGTPTLAGNMVTLTTSVQSVTTYTVTVSGVTRASDGEPLTTANASFDGRTGFNVASATSASRVAVAVTFDAPPNAAEATTLANYSVPGLTLSGAPVLAGNTVTITTSTQAPGLYTVTVTGVHRASDGTPLSIGSASFTHTTFAVASAAAVTSHAITVTYDAPPDPTQATTRANYSVPGLTLSGTPTLSGNTVTIATSAQSQTSYVVTVTGVTRAADAEPLASATASFTGRTPFDVASASSASSGSMTVTFDAQPDATEATTLGHYSVPGLTLSGTPVLSGNVVTLTTSAQATTTYTVTVTGVTRASDGEPLTTNIVNFTGTPVRTPTVTNVAVVATNPNNGATFYNTGTATVVITGTDFASVACPAGVALDDQDGTGGLISTRPTSCTIDSNTQITATFPAGIRSNGAFGWNVKLTNSAGTNATSAVRLVPLAGLLISEVYPGRTGATDEEFLELYNPTATSIDVAALGLTLHVRPANGGGDANKALTFVHTTIPSHGFFLIVSAQSVAADPWFARRDATYPANSNDLVRNGGVYVSLSGANNARVLDKVGWGTQPAIGVETTATSDIAPSQSAERKPAGGAGHATDSDNNASDFNAPSTSITPLGTLDPPQP